MTSEQVRNRVRVGRWAVLRPGVYVVAGVPDDPRQQVLAACLAGGATASHLTAARLWGLQLPEPTSVDVMTVEDRRVRLPGVVHHRSASLVDVDTGAGRRPTRAMRAVLDARSPRYRAGDSEREIDIVRLLAGAGFAAPALGHVVAVGRRRYKLDIAWPEAMVAIEFDGWDTHRTFTAFHGDRQRLRRIAALGWRVIPVTAQTDRHELIGDLRRVLVLSGHSAVSVAAR